MSPEIKSLIDSMGLSGEKRQWIEQYAEFHAHAEKNPQPEQVKVLQKDFFEIPDVMKKLWDNRNKTIV